MVALKVRAGCRYAMWLRRASWGSRKKSHSQNDKAGNDLCSVSVSLSEYHLCSLRSEKRMWRLRSLLSRDEHLEDSFSLYTQLHVSAYADLLMVSWDFCHSFFSSGVPGNMKEMVWETSGLVKCEVLVSSRHSLSLGFSFLPSSLCQILLW